MNSIFTFELKNNKIVAIYQYEVEEFALEELGTHANIFFDPIPLTDKIDLMYSADDGGWVLRYLLE